MFSVTLMSVLFFQTNYTIVHFKRLGTRVFHDSFNQYVSFFSKQYTYHKTNAMYT